MLDASTVFEVLAAEPRRHLLILLCEEDSVRVPDGLVKRGAVQAQQSTGEAPRGPSPQATQTLDLELTHTHLPKLEDEGLIEWDQEAGTVCRGAEFTEIQPILRLLIRNAEIFPAGFF